ncbi:G-alpha-domain-containing protein [Epithele typhae]|uniref:G-alpha-domain-containing protein n=1 Tax=Epithele typhae TaxID=378194 RepID=UPI0020073803|nr:G-alpha-domain-containing protein [Epithele typhae]KAH9931630.1 G-alpha-domain-containing protein [Epithele typhae]
MGSRYQVDDDPLARMLAPPPNETAEQKEARLRVEAEARQRSDKIDEQIKAERAAMKKNKPVKVLLLGQSESGKSTTLKNFQLSYCQDQWEAERVSWRMVIQLNLVRGINAILDVLSSELSGPAPPGADSDISDDDDDTTGMHPVYGSALLTSKHRLLKLRLAPLRTVQRDLELTIGIQAGDDMSDVTIGTSPPGSPILGPGGKKQEFFVRSATTWKKEHSHSRSELSGRRSKEVQMRETADILAGCAEDMLAVWQDAGIRELLVRKGIRMESTPGFFLNDIRRIASRHYIPTNDDVVRARLRTLGVQEHKIKLNKGPATGSDWYIYDVGGSRTQRMAWYPYFDDCDAIIFLAPINCFDERLTEDRRVNRLEDSYMLWRAVISSKLLAKTSIVLFLNKCDLLKEKLQSGVRIKDHVHSYGDRPNEVEHAVKYFGSHFKEILRKYSPEPRPFRVHHTSVVDTEATAVTLSVVEEGILREHLQRADLL